MTSALDPWLKSSWSDIGLQYVVVVGRGLLVLYILGVVFYFVERIRPVSPSLKFFKPDFWTEIRFPLFNLAVTTLVTTVLSLALAVFVLEPFAPRHLFAGVAGALPWPVQVFAALLLADIAVYLEHWVAHRYFWEFHAVHHATPTPTWLTYARVHPFNAMTIALSNAVIYSVFGFDGSAVAAGAVFMVPIGAFEHANLDLGWPKPFCYLFTSPRFHRWHHGKEPEAIDKNFCLIFPFLDRLMGTYYCPDRMPREYGIVGETFDPERETFRAQLMEPFRRYFRRIAGRPS